MPANRQTHIAHLRITRLLLLLLTALSATAVIKAQGQPPPFKITALKAMLFYDNTGAFSADVAAEDDGVFFVPSILWNTTIPGGIRPGSTSSTLVTVEVTGETQYQPLPRKIVLTARYIPLNRTRRETVIIRTTSIYVGEGGKFVAGFWLDETGCNPVRLSARIVGQRGPSRLKKIIKFGCGE